MFNYALNGYMQGGGGGGVRTYSPLILFTPELGLLYILSSSDPLYREGKKERAVKQPETHFCFLDSSFTDNNKIELSIDSLKNKK